MEEEVPLAAVEQPATEKRACRTRKPSRKAMEALSDRETRRSTANVEVAEEEVEKEEEKEKEEEEEYEEDSGNEKIRRCHWRGCGKEMTSESALTQHLYNSHISRLNEYQCGWEGCAREGRTKPYLGQGQLVEHVLTHLGIRTHHCTFEGCDKSYYKAVGLRIHMRTHTGELPYQCRYCEKKFNNACDRIKHEKRTHTTEKHIYKCTKCNKQYKDNSTLRKHVKDVHGEAAWERMKKAIQQSNAAKRMPNATVSKEEEEEQITNDQLVKDEDREESNTPSTSGELRIVKEEIGYEIKTKFGRKRGRPKKGISHLASIADGGSNEESQEEENEEEEDDGTEKSRQCQWRGCQKTYSTASKLMEHTYNSHLERLKEYKCDWEGCVRDKAFKVLHRMVEHMRTHVGLKSHHCAFPGCDHSFYRRESLLTHSRTHTGECPYACKHCGRAFANASSRAKHTIRVHSEKKRYPCPIPNCDKQYKDSSSVRKHIKLTHGEDVWERIKKPVHKSYTEYLEKKRQKQQAVVKEESLFTAEDHDYAMKEEEMGHEEANMLEEPLEPVQEVKTEDEMEFEEFANYSPQPSYSYTGGEGQDRGGMVEVKEEPIDDFALASGEMTEVKEEPMDDLLSEVKEEEIDAFVMK